MLNQGLIGFFLLSCVLALGSRADVRGPLEIEWQHQGKSEILGVDSAVFQPKGGRRGIVLAELIEKAIEKLTPEDRAQVDLIGVPRAEGDIWIPRSLVVKYPVLLAVEGKKPPVAEGYQVVLPWGSAGFKAEPLPLESYQVGGIRKLVLTTSKDRYGAYFLKKRTDPAAMRGEKLFVQTCIACHGGPQAVIKVEAIDRGEKQLPAAGHPSTKGAPKLSDKDLRALKLYLETHRAEKAS